MAHKGRPYAFSPPPPPPPPQWIYGASLTDEKFMVIDRPVLFPVILWSQEHHTEVGHIHHWVSVTNKLPVHNSLHIKLWIKKQYVNIIIILSLYRVKMLHETFLQLFVWLIIIMHTYVPGHQILCSKHSYPREIMLWMNKYETLCNIIHTYVPGHQILCSKHSYPREIMLWMNKYETLCNKNVIP